MLDLILSYPELAAYLLVSHMVFCAFDGLVDGRVTFVIEEMLDNRWYHTETEKWWALILIAIVFLPVTVSFIVILVLATIWRAFCNITGYED